ncbi:MAG: phosphatase PAP2 family protein [Bacteroidota bacterium]|nr:phosphatase PAP2 family protein [Bacteroidota bacterium]MDP4252286.1 phosphatase PAP2 family protein [Bacteroidota bacterium]
MEILLAFCLFLLSLFFLCLLIQLISLHGQNQIDARTFLVLKPLVSLRDTRIAMGITFLGTGSFLVPMYALIVSYCVRKKQTKYATMVLVIALSSLILGWLLKAIFHRPRPLYPLVSGAGGYSFPSGHALGGFIFSLTVLYLVWQTQKSLYLKWICSLVIIAFGTLVGLSRIYLHVHYATDVLGSLFITLVWCSVFYVFFQFYYKNKMQEGSLLYDSDTGGIAQNFNVGNGVNH